MSFPPSFLFLDILVASLDSDSKNENRGLKR